MCTTLLFRDDLPAFCKLSYWEQWDSLVTYAVRTGNRLALPLILFHMLVFACLLYTSPSPRDA